MFDGKKAAMAATFVVGLLAGLGAGAYLGFRQGSRMILDEAVGQDAKEIRTLVGALKDLRAGDTTRAAESLESRLDDELIVMDPQEPFAIPVATQTDVDNAIRAAKEYRSANPRTSKRTVVDGMVANLFKRY